MKHIFWLLLACTHILHASTPIKIVKIETINGQANAALSFDNNTGTSWFPGWSTPSAKATITFDQTYQISRVRYFDGTGQPRLNIYADANAPTPLKSIALSQYWVWLTQDLDIETNSLTIEIVTIQGDLVIPEIEFYGKPVKGGTASPETPAVSITGLATSKISVCGFHWVPLDKMQPFAMRRDFQMSGWTWSPMGFSPDPLYGAASRDVQGYDKYFADAKAAGLTIVPCVNETPEWFWNLPPAPAIYSIAEVDVPYYNPRLNVIDAIDTLNEPPVPLTYSTSIHPKTLPKGAGFQKTDPFGYISYARFMFQYAARYGRQKWDDNAIEVNEEHLYPNSPINEKKSGLDLLQYIEPWNEPDAWWLDTTVYAQPEQFAAFMSAVYDGHCGRMGAQVGIKSADSTMIVVMPGLTGADKKYLERVVAWCRKNRPDQSLPWDICNFHFYNNTGNMAGRWPPTWLLGTPADMDAAWPDVTAYVAYVKSLGQKVWWTEMGYDTKTPSWQYARPYGPYAPDSVQAMWLVRNYLTGIAAGIDNIFIFNAINEPGAPNGGLYQNSGVLYGAGDATPFAPKPSWYAIAAMTKALQGYKYKADLSVGATVKILAFSKPGKTMIAYWSPTNTDKKVPFKYQGRSFTAQETVQYAEFGNDIRFISKSNLFTKVFKPASMPKLRK